MWLTSQQSLFSEFFYFLYPQPRYVSNLHIYYTRFE